MTYHIANHYLSIEGDHEEDMLRLLPGFPLFVCDDCQNCDWIVRFGCELDIPQNYEVLYSCNTDEKAFHFTFAKDEKAFYFFMNENDSTDSLNATQSPFVMRFQGGRIVEASHCFDASILRFALWISFGMLSASSRIVLIHSSVIVHQGKAVLFLGESGTGKSTHTRLWLQCIPNTHLLNDDSPILAIEKGMPMVYGSPWSGKTHCYHSLRFPLTAVVRLSQAPYNKITRQPVLGAFAALQPSCPPFMAQDNFFSENIISLLSDVISIVPVYCLECLPNTRSRRIHSRCNIGIAQVMLVVENEEVLWQPL